MDYSDFRRHCLTRPHTLYQFSCGSAFEFSLLYYSVNVTDIDKILYHHEICAIPWNRKPPKKFKGIVLSIESTETPPGFAKLKVCRGVRSEYFHRPNFLKYKEASAGPAFKVSLDAPKITKRILDRAKLQPVRGNMKGDWQFPNDLVYGVYCPYWPPEAEEWKRRIRSHGWPDEALIARIVNGGCHFVSKSPTESVVDDSVWRFSFSKAELILIHSWTNIQKYVYHVVRLIKTDIAKKCSKGENKSLQTYYFKTLMFWFCEEKPKEYWSESNIETCVCEILRRTIECLNDKHCPLYFIREVNILNQLENGFSEELELLMTYINKYAKKFIDDNFYIFKFSGPTAVYSDLGVEKNLISLLGAILPFNKELSGRLGQYLAESEWFLPEMVFLHRAVETNLRLMTIENASSRRESEDCKTCLENFQLALSNTRYLEPTLTIDCRLSFYNNIRENLLAQESNRSARTKILNGKHILYIRMTCTDVKKDVEGYIRPGNVVDQTLRCEPLPMFLVTTAYRTNFYFTALGSYDLAYRECTQCLQTINKFRTRTDYPEAKLTLLISTSLSSIYDEHIQAILGFATLQKFCTSASANTTNRPEVSLNLSAWQFLEYVRVQCERKLLGTFTQIHYQPSRFSEFSSLLQTRDFEDISTVVFYAALRQSGANDANPPVPLLR